MKDLKTAEHFNYAGAWKSDKFYAAGARYGTSEKGVTYCETLEEAAIKLLQAALKEGLNIESIRFTKGHYMEKVGAIGISGVKDE